MKRPLGISDEELRKAIYVVEYLQNHPDENQNVGLVKKLKYHVRTWLDIDWKKNQKATNIQDDKEILDTTGIRSGRKRKKELQESWTILQKRQANNLITFHPEDRNSNNCSNEILFEESKQELKEQEKEVVESIEVEDMTTMKKTIYLKTSMICYVCKKEVKEIHHFYDQMCETCGEFNFTKRNQTVNLTGKVALLTGGRIKIGYETSLKLLRTGCSLIITTRFPNDATLRYSREPDFLQWKEKLYIYALDMRFLGEVEQFCLHIMNTFSRLDIIINNAAQTIRRPPVFYKHLIAAEKSPSIHKELVYSYNPNNNLQIVDNETKLIKAQNYEGIISNFGVMDSKISPAELTQIPLIPEDIKEDPLMFPNDELDMDGQQVDLRTNNSWILKMDTVSTVELAEVHMVNSLAPFVINSKLKAFMAKSGDKTFIVNVSSMEGKFSRNKKATHPHTNMAKASMNMMTRTSAKEFAEENIYMNSVDTGWITYENPCELTEKKQQLGLQPPIDEIDGAARILDPVFASVATGEYAWGLFYKDYYPSKW